MDLAGGLDINTDSAVSSGLLDIRPIGRVAGAEIVGLDLSQPFGDDIRDAIMAALNEYHVLSFPDQQITKDQQLAFTERFGEVEGHVSRTYEGKASPLVHMVSNLDQDGKPTKTPRSHGNYFWHTDKSYHDLPSLASMLYAVEIPPFGGATQFANMVMAYDELMPEMKEKIQGLRVVHSWEQSRKNSFNTPATPEQIAERPPVSHPIVRTHPDTGEKGVYIGIHASHIEGMDWHEGREILYRLTDLVTQPRFVYTHEWKKNELVIWDNRCLMHRATGDFPQDVYPRVLHRTVVRGTKPV
ncbi:MAG: TauD/TfdA family dioxygenase [Proteobacteria bacterium]|nr:TauD/TfdA family dioxygenase [Pseudomonadota bacterium]